MRSAFNKDTLRSISRSLGRFVAIAAIVALGTGFYAGLRMTAPDMKQAADVFYDGTDLMDVRVVSTLGLTDADVDALRDVEGVASVMPAFETDVMGTINGEQYATRVHSLPSSAQDSDTSDGIHAVSSDSDYLNRLILVDGAWPTKPGECVLSADKVMNEPTNLGDTVQITEWQQEDALVTSTYTVVGYVRSSYYATSSALGSTTLGSGAIQQFMYVPQSDFSTSLPYSEAFVTVEGAEGDFAGGDAYRERVSAVMDRIEALAPEREEARTVELRDEAQRTLDERRAEYDREKSAAMAQLADARRTLDEADSSLAKNEGELADAQARHDAGVADLENARASAAAQLEAAHSDLANARCQLDAGHPALEAGQAQLADAWGSWQQSADALAAEWAAWHASADPLYAALAAMQDGIDSLDAQIAALDPAAPDYEVQKALLEGERDVLSLQLDQFRQDHAGQIAAAEAAKAQLDEGQRQLDAAQSELGSRQAAFDAEKTRFDTAAAQVEQGAVDLAAARSQADAQLSDAQRQLDDAAAQIASGRAQLEQGRRDYEAGVAEYEQKRADADRQFADAEQQLDEAQGQIDDMESASWLIMDRDKNYGVASFDADADRVDNIAQVFPFIFFLVAALVSLTTMTRMVEEERVLIGTYKALGYGKGRIASKYLIYAAVASGVGGAVGIAVLSQVLPAVIMKAYAIIYFVPSMSFPLPIDWPLAFLAFGLGVGVTLVATWGAVWAALRERPAALMLPRAPKAGKRILLERLTPVWRRLSFSWKVTFRNLFRYKRRFIMTVIGIAGCTALLLTGLGLSDAINDIIDKQFGDITKYNTTITVDDRAAEGGGEASGEHRPEFDAVMDDGAWVEAHASASVENLLVGGPGESDVQVDLVVPEDPSGFGAFFSLRTRVGHDDVELSDDGLVLTEKLANELGVGVGDEIELTEQDSTGNATNTSYWATVTGIVENYIYHYVFMGPALYEQLFGEAPVYGTEYAIVTSDGAERAQFGEALRAVDGVKTITYNDEAIDSYRDMLSSVNMIVVVLVVAAAALAFIVLYNLTNINITERMREIATLKVLGFTRREMNAYIFRETFLLAAIGCVVGLVIGVWMEGFIVVTAEVDQMMFGRDIHPASFVIAFALTMVFTAVVMFAMRGKLAKIDMVESLKSNE